MSDVQALIEEARLEAEKRYDYFTPTTVDIAAVADEKAAAFIRGAEWAAARLADALEASEGARQVEVDDMHVALIEARIKHNDLRHGIAALADEILALVSGDSRERSDG